MSKIVLALSGGLDSTTLLSRCLDEGREVLTVHFQYGSTHNPWELDAVSGLLGWFGQSHRCVDLRGVFANTGSSLMGAAPIPEEHYAAESMRSTVVPGRNLIFASVLASIAEATGADAVGLGVHAGDHHIYPDCRPDFVFALSGVVRASTEGKVGVYAPFLHVTKADIVREGLRLETPYALTRTCYKAQGTPCGVCGSCRERLEAFELNGVKDPVVYS